MKTLRAALCAVAIATAWPLWTVVPVHAAQSQEKLPGATAERNHIDATSGDVRIEWNGKSGTFSLPASQNEPARALSIALIYDEAGPAGYAHHLAWFLARDATGFAVLWCYLDDTGDEFWAWIYRYPNTDLETLKFTGKYRFVSPEAGRLVAPPTRYVSTRVYTGAPFFYKDWNRASGTLANLPVKPVNAIEGTPTALKSLRVTPLDYVQVGDANGWNSKGWYELHALAAGPDADRYYLILYSNTAQGFAIRLSDGCVFKADYGERVRFQTAGPAVAAPGLTFQALPTMTVKRFQVCDIELVTAQKSADPYNAVDVRAELISPNANRFTSDCFWDGGSVWRMRVSPNEAGVWQWRIASSLADLDGKSGAFECVPEDDSDHEPISINPNHPCHFIRANGATFIPFCIMGPEHATDKEFDGLVSAAAAQGVTRLGGGCVLESTVANAPEGKGFMAFADTALQRLDPMFFQHLDSRVESALSHGISPDLGIARSAAPVLRSASQTSIQRLWRYIVARYGAFDIFWNLFEIGPDAAGTSVEKSLDEQLAAYCSGSGVTHHLVTAPITSGARARTAIDVPPWMDMATVSTLGAAVAVLATGHAVTVQSVASGDDARREMWLSRMHGAYWAPRRSGAVNEQPVPTWLSQANALFAKTRYYRLKPHSELVSRSDGPARAADVNRPIVLADPGWEYVVYFPKGGSVSIDATEAIGHLALEWMECTTGQAQMKSVIDGGIRIALTAPGPGEWVAYVSRR